MLLLIVLAASGCARREAPAPIEYGIKNDGFVDDNYQAQHHRVVRGDTIVSIARRYVVSVAQLAEYNKLTNINLKIGQILMIPQRSAAGAAPEKVQVVSSVPIIKSQQEGKEVESAPRSLSSDRYAEQLVRSKPAKASDKASPEELERKLDAQLASIKGKKTSPTTEPQKKNVSPKKVESGQVTLNTPLQGKILSKYKSSLGDGYNDGINIAAKLGAPVRAAGSGVVLFASDQLKAYGNLILIKHNDSLMTVYGHLSKIAVKKGAKVHGGTIIGLVGKSGNVSIPQLHFEVRLNKVPVNPSKFIKQ
ncbi:MAG: peptidoglycan DD-metalloendopeptidase family protein [Holosporales bacterium]|nr:peptidoglycan DD-metalloendopeptidase family protein [Holosporales bacterium]